MRTRTARKILVASIGVASLSYVACDRPAATPAEIEVAPPDAAPAPTDTSPPVPTSVPIDAGAHPIAATDAGAPPLRVPPPEVFVDARGKIVLDGAPVAEAELEKRLEAAKAAGATAVKIVAEVRAPNAAIVRATDVAKKVGLPVAPSVLRPPTIDGPTANLMPPPVR